MTDDVPTRTGLSEEEIALLKKLRAAHRDRRHRERGPAALTPGQRIADAVAATMGSWRFIIIQTTILVLWITLNVIAWISHWDPYPFILLNLALSFQAAYAAPFIMMSQNRQQDVDRQHAAEDFRVNVKAELEIELVHQKLDELRDKEVLSLVQSIETLTALLHKQGATGAKAGAAKPAPKKRVAVTPRYAEPPTRQFLAREGTDPTGLR